MIDCRRHLIKQSLLQKRTIVEITEECVKRYLQVIQEIITMKYRVLIWNVIVNVRLSGTKIIGTLRERNETILLFNSILKSFLPKEIYFIDICDVLIKNFSVKKQYYKDNNHLCQKMMPIVIERLENARIIKK